MTGIIGHSERNEMQSKNLKVDVSTTLNMTVKDVSTNAQHDKKSAQHDR